QHLQASEMLDHDVERHPIAGDGNSDRLRDHRGDQLRIADRRQGDEIDSSGKALHELGRDLEAEPGLADAPRAGECEEASAFEKTPRLRNLPLAADEAGQLRRQIVWRRIERAQRGKYVRNALDHQLEELL